jgi:hypothetical protein
MNTNRSMNQILLKNQTFVEVSVQERDVAAKNKPAERFFDVDKFNKLTGGYDKIQEELLGAFLEFTPVLLEELKYIVSSNNAEDAARILHKLKSSTSLLCTDVLYAEIIHLEETSNTIHGSEYKDRIVKLIASHEVLMDEARAMQKILSS